LITSLGGYLFYFCWKNGDKIPLEIFYHILFDFKDVEEMTGGENSN